MIIRDDSYDKIMVPFAFAHLHASEGVQVDMLFLSWTVNALKQGGAEAFNIKTAHSDKEDYIRQQVDRIGMSSDIYSMLKGLKGTDCVNFYPCSLAATVFDITEENLIPEASGGIVGAS